LVTISNFPQRFGMPHDLSTYATMQTIGAVLRRLAFFLVLATLGFGILFFQ